MVRLAFISNYFSHHQKPLSDALAAEAEQYHFIASVEMDAERKRLGWTDGAGEPYLCRADGKSEQMILQQSNVIMAGSAPEKLVQQQIRAGKLVFRYSERPLKNGAEWRKALPRFFRWHSRNPARKPVYLLCASAFTAGDYAKFGLFRGRAYRWGYFPQTLRYPSIEDLISRKNKRTILWCGRFLDWKHADDVIAVAKRLKAAEEAFQMELIGVGEMEAALRQMTTEAGLTQQVHFLGSMPPEAVRQHMEASGIYLFTSDRKEGWGAVLNEAMNSGCAVVASDAAGATPYLVEHGVNGTVYHSGDVQELYEAVVRLLNHPERQAQLGAAAYETITELWNAEVAANRLLQLSQAILNGEKHPDLFPSGPCSRAEIIREDWYKT